MKSSTLIAAVVVVVLAVAAGVITAKHAVSSDADRADAAASRRSHEADRDAVQQDVDDETDLLVGLKDSLGSSALPVHEDPVEAPDGVTSGLISGDMLLGDFHDTFIDEGIVLTGVAVQEVDEIPRKPIDTYPPKPQKPLKPESDEYRLLQVDIKFTNRSGSGADPACGLNSGFGGPSAITDKGEDALILPTYENVGTYDGACGAGLPDGGSGIARLAIGLKKGDKLAALTFPFLGPGGTPDEHTQALVLEKPA